MTLWHLTSRVPKGGSNPVTRVLLLILLGLVVIVALVFGIVILAILLLAAACFFAVLYLRTLWLRYRLGLDTHLRDADAHPHGITLEGEYTVNKPDKKESS